MDSRCVVMMCGLPVAGKTTTAMRLHAATGGVLIRSCDVYQALGIDLPAWVRRTVGFTRDVDAYLAARDRAYVEMGARLERALAAGAGFVIVDAVHGERTKRQPVYGRCRTHGVLALLLWCRCDHPDEIARRFAARAGRQHEPESEAADLSVLRHLSGLWEDPGGDPEVAAGEVPLVGYDTLRGAIEVPPAAPPVVEVIRQSLGEGPRVAAPCDACW